MHTLDGDDPGFGMTVNRSPDLMSFTSLISIKEFHLFIKYTNTNVSLNNRAHNVIDFGHNLSM